MPVQLGGVARPKKPASWWTTDGCEAESRAAASAEGGGRGGEGGEGEIRGSSSGGDGGFAGRGEDTKYAVPPGGGASGCGGAWVLENFTVGSERHLIQNSIHSSTHNVGSACFKRSTSKV